MAFGLLAMTPSLDNAPEAWAFPCYIRLVVFTLF